MQAPAIARANADGQSVTLVWYYARGATGGYDIERSHDPAGATQLIAHVRAGTSGFTDPAPGPAPWYYRVVAVSAAGDRAPSAQVALVPPVISGVVSSGNDVLISWTRNGPSASYVIVRTRDPSVAGTTVGGGTSPYRDRNVGSGQLYYRVVAFSPGSVTAASDWVAAGAVPASATAVPSTPAVAATAAPGPKPLTLTAQLAAAGAFVIPNPVALQAQLAVAGGFSIPAPADLQATLSTAGGFMLPAALTITSRLDASGKFATAGP